MQAGIDLWPDRDGCKILSCDGTERNPGCGAKFGAVAVHPVTGQICGRNRCPQCGRSRPIPSDLHAVYVQWLGLIDQAMRPLVQYGMPPEEARDALHDAYIEALLRWLNPREYLGLGMGQFSTFATHHLRWRGLTILREWRSRQIPHSLTADVPDNRDHEEEAACLEMSELTRARVTEALKYLTSIEAKVLRLRFGIGCKPHSHREIGRKIKLTYQRAQQIESEAKAKLTRLLRDEDE